VLYVAAIMIVASVALFVAAPLAGGLFRRRRVANELDLERLEHERGLAVQGLRELEFDHEMGKLDDADYRELKATLEARALAAIGAIDRAKGAGRVATMRLASRRSKASSAMQTAVRRFNFCPQCGVRSGAAHNFCAECGAALNPDARPTVEPRAATRTE
jgi:ribosomal protein L32/HAMP domain-containing protein